VNRSKPLTRTAGLRARTRLSRGDSELSRNPWPRPGQNGKGAPARRAPIPRVSVKRARENRERAKMADRLWPDRRDGTVMCGCGRPECNRRADDGHEILSRARGGSITDETIIIPLARECHQEIQLGPDWAYRAGLMKHSGLCCQGRRVCAQYAGDGAA